MDKFVRSTPVAQTLVLRRVLTGGISADSGRLVFLLTQYGHPLRRWSWNGPGGRWGGLVFGTLLGPEATGPWPAAALTGVGAGCGFVCFWFPGCIDHACFGPFAGLCVWGVWYGVVV